MPLKKSLKIIAVFLLHQGMKISLSNPDITIAPNVQMAISEEEWEKKLIKTQ
jgi:hypothetical protein